jgi:hypothetical protein
MNHLEGTTFLKLLQVAAIILVLEAVTAGQSLESKLAQKVAFIPKGTSALGQLIEVAQYYKIQRG